MTTVGISPPIFLQFFNPNNTGAPAAGYKLFTYIAGSSTKQETYTDSSGSVQNANPIILDSNGIARLWLDVSKTYKYVIAPPNDSDPPTSPVWTQDNIGTVGIFVPGVYQPTFQSGPVLYKGPTGIAADNNLIFGLNLPNPSGINGAGLLIGSGGGGGVPIQAWIITDQAFDNSTPGNTLGITAGETQNAGTANGGDLLEYGGASFGGTGGRILLEGGTSFNGAGGQALLHGGNSTNGASGDTFVLGGETGTAGSNVHLIMTKVNGVAGNVRIRVNSTILYQFAETGDIFIGATGAGNAGQSIISQGAGASTKWAGSFSHGDPGYDVAPSGTITQWGGGTIDTNTTITFPLAFPNACTSVCFSPVNTTNQIYITSISTTGFVMTNGTSAAIRYIAVGY